MTAIAVDRPRVAVDRAPYVEALFFATVFTVTFAKLQWEVAGTMSFSDVVTAVLMHMLGDLTGRTLLLFPEMVGRRVCDMLLRRPAGTTKSFDVLEQSCLKEAGNILSGAYMNALSDFMGMLLLPSVPSLVVDLSAAVLTTAAAATRRRSRFCSPSTTRRTTSRACTRRSAPRWPRSAAAMKSSTSMTGAATAVSRFSARLRRAIRRRG